MSDRVISDQLNNWSDAREQERPLFAKEAPPTRFATVTVRSRTSRLSHRAIQTLREAGLSLRKRTRTRAKVLPIHQSIGSSTRDALRSPKLRGPSQKLPERLWESSRNPKRDNEYQPGAVEEARAFLERKYAAYGSHVRNDSRLRRSRDFACEHARGRVARGEHRERESGGGP